MLLDFKLINRLVTSIVNGCFYIIANSNADVGTKSFTFNIIDTPGTRLLR